MFDTHLHSQYFDSCTLIYIGRVTYSHWGSGRGRYSNGNRRQDCTAREELLPGHQLHQSTPQRNGNQHISEGRNE